jgi:Family of unknown function (DUF5670)
MGSTEAGSSWAMERRFVESSSQRRVFRLDSGDKGPAPMAHPLLLLSALEDRMLWTIAVILGVLWLLGLVSSYTMGGFIHLLLVLAIVVVLLNIIQGRRLV